MSTTADELFTLRLAADGWAVEVLDQTLLPHQVALVRLETPADAARAITRMVVRGAPLIGATAAYGLALGLRADPQDRSLSAARELLLGARPTAVNLRWALDAVQAAVLPLPPGARAAAAYQRAQALCDEDVQTCAAIGEHGRAVIEQLWQRAGRRRPVQILTHCNAGWLCSLRWGTALAPIYKAHAAGVPLHVWVDETRPRNQGAALTAWELGRAGIPHTVVVDNAGGHLMQRGLVDMCLVGSDRTTASGDVCNKIGTYLKALAARAHDVPFYVGLPGPTIDWRLTGDGLTTIPIEERPGDEVRRIAGRAADGRMVTVDLLPAGSPVANPAFDVTPAALVTGLITERGVCPASSAGLAGLYPERR